MNKIRMATALIAAAAGFGFCAEPAAAQTGGLLPIRVKVGVFLPQDGSTSFNGEVELALPSAGAGRTLISAGYAEASDNGRDLRIIPVTVARVFSPPNPVSGLTGNIYFGVGVGAYFLRASGRGASEEETQFGGFGVVGYQFPTALFVEAKYHVAGKVAGVSPNGLALLLGRRF